MNRCANMIISIGTAVFLFIASPLVCVDSVTAFPIEHRTRAFLFGEYMPKGMQGFQKGHRGFKKLTLRTCEIEGCNNKHHGKGLCQKHYSKQYKEDNPKYHKQWREDNREYIAEQMKQYRQDNKEYYKQWFQTPVGKACKKAHNHNHRALTKDLTKEIIQRVYEANIAKYGVLTCYLCFKPIVSGDERLKDSLEHSIPITRQGTNDYDNLGIAHKSCNSEKHTQTLEEWVEND